MAIDTIEAPLSSLKFRSHYRKAHGHYPQSDELKALIKATNLPFVMAVHQVYNHTYAQFRQMHLGTLSAPDGYGFVYGDSPVLFANATPNGWLLGFKEGARWGKGYADQFMWPVSRKVVLLLEWRDIKFWVIRPESCIRLNRMQLQGTEHYVGCHPDDDPSKLLGVSLIRRPSRYEPFGAGGCHLVPRVARP